MSLRVTDEEYASLRARTGKAQNVTEQPVTKKRSKFRNQPVTLDGVRFDSKGEAARYVQLRDMQAAGKISDLEPHPTYALDVNGVHICNYEADFVYFSEGAVVVEDFKGVVTPLYTLKKRLLRAIHGIEVKEVRRTRS